jgi:hypothetical protein
LKPKGVFVFLGFITPLFSLYILYESIINVSGVNQLLCVTVQTSNLAHMILIYEDAGGSGRGICKSVTRNGRLSAKLPNLHAPLGSTSCGLN